MDWIFSDAILQKNIWCYLTKSVTLKVSNCSVAQWSTLLLELNLMSKAWARFGPEIELQAPSIEKIIKLGTSTRREATKELVELTSSRQ